MAGQTFTLKKRIDTYSQIVTVGVSRFFWGAVYGASHLPLTRKPVIILIAGDRTDIDEKRFDKRLINYYK